MASADKPGFCKTRNGGLVGLDCGAMDCARGKQIPIPFFINFYEGQYTCSKDRVIENLNSKGVNWNRTSLIEGYYNDSLVDGLAKDQRMKQVAVALIDCDLYQSTRPVMDFLESMLVDGSVLMMDDWNCFDSDDAKGQRRALAEFQQTHDQWTFEDFFSYGTWGQVFIARSRT